MQCRVARVAALIDQHLRRLVLLPDGDQLLGPRMGLAEVNAESALSVVDLLHVFPLPLKADHSIGKFHAPASAATGARL